jgi:hypothetical protein
MTKILVLSALVAFLGLHAVVTAVTLYPEAPLTDACNGGSPEPDAREPEGRTAKEIPMRQFFALLLACTLAAGSAVATTHHSAASWANCADYSGTSW